MKVSRRRLLYLVTAAGCMAALAGTVWVGRTAAQGNVGAPVRQGAATGHTISVAGHGEIQVTPDQATLTLGVQTKAQDAQAAMSNNSSKTSQVIAAIEGQGVPAKNIQTSNLSLYHDDQQDTYVASHQLTVKVDQINNVGKVIDAAVGAGANNAWGIAFGLKNPASTRAQVLAAAVTDARNRANSLASALGVSITGVGSVSETAFQEPPPIRYGGVAAAPAPAPSTPVQAGELTVTADISVVYTFG